MRPILEEDSPARAVKEPLAHIAALDGIRGCAILLVLAFHLLWSNSESTQPVLTFLLRVKGAGWIGVDLFFALSGFLITGILFDSLGDRRFFRNFYARRVFRIFPLYYGVVIGVCIVLFAAHEASADNLRRLSLVAVFLQNTPAYLDGAFFARTYHWTGHFWSLAVEEQFYLVWPMLVFLIRKRSRLMVLALLLALAAPITRVLMIDHGVDIRHVYAFTICRQDSLLCGAWLALAVRGPMRTHVLRIAWMPLLAALLAIAFIGWRYGNFDYNINDAVNRYGYTFIAIAGTSTIALALRTGSLTQRLMNWNFLRFFGRYSYGIYIFHPIIENSPVGLFDHLAFWTMFHSKWILHLVHLITVLGVTIPIAMLSFHLYEKRFLRFKRFFNYSKQALQHRATLGRA